MNNRVFGFLMLGLLACRTPTATVSQATTGKYALQTVNGAALAAGVSGSIELQTDSIFLDILTTSVYSDTLQGKYAIRLDSVYFKPIAHNSYAGKLQNAILAVAWSDGIFVYKK